MYILLFRLILIDCIYCCCSQIATAFRQYYFSTQDTEWLRTAGFPMMNGLAQYYASRFKLGADGKLHVYNTTGPDEYNANVTDSTYNNAVGIMALRSAYELAAAAGAVPNTTYERLAALVYLPYDVERDYHPEFEGWSTSTHGGLIKQADTVLMQYPLNFPMNVSTRRNDMRIFDAATDVKGVAMGWAVISLIHKDLGDADKAAHFFRVAYNTTSPPFYEWHEGFGQEGSSAQGAPNFVTGAGGWLQTVVNGFGGLRWERPGVLTLHDPQPLPNSTKLRLRGVSFLGARLDIVATARGWTVALSSRVMGTTDGVPPALELVMEAGTDGAANSVRLTHTPVARKRGMVGLVRRVSHQAVVDLLYS
jgi:trehalose/maltose hydrolase-like predicted phosphorylase